MKRLITILLICSIWFATGSSAGGVTSTQLDEINTQWRSSSHALAEVNCSSCHQTEQNEFVANPQYTSCQSCHEFAVQTFEWGKHGVRLGEGLSPLTPAMAHLPMKESALNEEMTCNACHNVHSVDTVVAAVDSCLGCHNDNHSLNYKNSKHAQLWQAEVGEIERPTVESVTCATCHLPRQEVNSTVLVNHNNTYTLLPRDRLVKEVCMNCHGVEYSFNSIFDDEMVEANFDRQPTASLETFELVRDLEQKRSSEATR